MNFDQLATGMTVDLYRQLKTAVEIGRWPNGEQLTEQQKQISLEAVLRYEIEHLPPEQRTGYITPKIGSHCGSKTDVVDYDPPQTLRWQE